MIYNCIVLLLCAVCVRSNYEGDNCDKDGLKGVCLNLSKCQSAINDIKNRRNPQICSFDGSNPIVCCVEDIKPLTTSPPSAETTTEYIPPVYDYQTKYEEKCEPISRNLTSPKTGQKAWDKCVDYQEQLVYPCEKTVALSGDYSRVRHCKQNTDELIVGGTEAKRGEFPHMVLLGFGDSSESAQWLCGGSLISDRFILTAGHCTSSREHGPVTYAILSSLLRSEKTSNSKVYRISRIIKHPDFKPPSKYNDIALLETEVTMKLDQFAVPACLDVGNIKNVDKAIATGWGDVTYKGSASDVLQKVTLTKFSREECAAKFPVTRLMKQGFDFNTQICYGDKTMSKDTCQGDSGGPLQVKNPKIHCMYTLIGVTSFGKACGFVGDPGIYTRVSAYVPWIESIVWA